MKQVILVRQDLKLPKGKLAVQVAHASVECVLKSDKKTIDDWHSLGMKKSVLKVAGLKELKEYQAKAKASKLVNALITDAGLTAVPAGTVTCLGIGPDDDKKIDSITGHLKLI